MTRTHESVCDEEDFVAGVPMLWVFLSEVGSNLLDKVVLVCAADVLTARATEASLLHHHLLV
ncbi:hypothetical protein [Nocardia vinacea]|uniref:hypothetical protein n=1 Tax=Nocardia vinacea TaxID=96468 RepID=UPI00157B60C8